MWVHHGLVPRPLPPPLASPTRLLLMFQRQRERERETRRRPLDELGTLTSKCSLEEIILILKDPAFERWVIQETGYI